MISLIVAHDEQYVIGKDNDMPWHLPGDLQYFKAQTMGKPVIMGRKTFESIGRPLPGRRNIVITRNRDYSAEGIEVVYSLAEALALTNDAPEQMVIGGQQIFTEALPLATRLYITHIDTTFEGDTFFPRYPGFQLIREQAPIETPEGYTFRYCIYEK
ncbi:dihydrofolate reductase [Caryophanon tenue]|uniref:Dihydrofolate reductase n=1 Tax=Caryophanon tenue TaxID=33978 RepID=A0A1C0YND9_9BACL|nr:dihydrofolate reductase [Caryophanon tenue]OCS88686.1 dihydrofolate reductase [Caryophanon tenue]